MTPSAHDLHARVRERGIRYLYHFTALENVRRIFTRGLIGRERLSAADIDACVADPLRADPFQSASCLSIGFPAYRMFYKRRQEDLTRAWVVLQFGAELLWNHRVAFCATNAASARYRDMSVSTLGTVKAFDEMFAPMVGQQRDLLGIPQFYPTDPQAEVLVLDTIQPYEIQAVLCEKSEAMTLLSARVPSKHHGKLEVNRYLFQPRQDHAYWSAE